MGNSATRVSVPENPGRIQLDRVAAIRVALEQAKLAVLDAIDSRFEAEQVKRA